MMNKFLQFLLALIVSVSLAGQAFADLSEVGTDDSDDQGGASWTTTTLTKPSGVTTGDLLIIALMLYEFAADEAPVLPTGFTARSSVVVGGSGSTESILYIWTRVVDTTEGSTFTVGRSSNAHFSSAGIFALRGSSALSVDSVTYGSPGSSVTSITAPSVSGTAGQGLVAIFALDDPPTASSKSQTEGMTLAIATPENTGNFNGYFETLSATESTGTRELTWTTSRNAVGVSILVNGAGTGGGSSAVPLILQQVLGD